MLLIGRQSFECDCFPNNFRGEFQMTSVAVLHLDLIHGYLERTADSGEILERKHDRFLETSIILYILCRPLELGRFCGEIEFVG